MKSERLVDELEKYLKRDQAGGVSRVLILVAQVAHKAKRSIKRSEVKDFDAELSLGVWSDIEDVCGRLGKVVGQL